MKAFKDAGIVLSDEFAEDFDMGRLGEYYEFLLEAEKKYSLFSRSDSERILDRHLYESAVMVHKIRLLGLVSRETKVADAGTGPGLPGYLFRCLKEYPKLTLIDSSKRKLSLLESWYNQTYHDNDVLFKYGRIEEIRNKFDVISARAMVKFPFVAEVLMPALKPGGTIIVAHSSAEIGEWESKYLHRLGFVSRETYVLEELSFLGKRTIIILKKLGRTEKGYPRNWKKIKEDIDQWEK